MGSAGCADVLEEQIEELRETLARASPGALSVQSMQASKEAQRAGTVSWKKGKSLNPR